MTQNPVLNIILQFMIVAIPAGVAGIFSYRQSVKTARLQESTEKAIADSKASNERAIADQQVELERAKLDLERRRMGDEADERARALYGQMITDVRGELDRMHKTVERMQDAYDRVAKQLSQEQEVSNKLRNDIHTWRAQVDQMRDRIAALEHLVKTLGGQLPDRATHPPPLSTQ
jgi:chromosome segregation ATPase